MELTQGFAGYEITKATADQAEEIWKVLQQAILKRKNEGSNQWQDGYPNLEIVNQDIQNGSAYVVLNENKELVAYFSLVFGIEKEYQEIIGAWKSDQPYGVIHRIVVNQSKSKKGLATWMMTKVEAICKQNGYFSLRADTNYDNAAMLRVFEKLGYLYCGKVYFRGGERQAYEKVL